MRPTSCPVEPLIPNAPPVGKSPLPPWPGERLDRLWDQVDRWFWPTRQALGPDPVTIPLSLAEAQRGGRVRIWLALPTPCPSCRGYGGVGFYECAHCAGQGTIVEQRPVWLSFPAGLADRSEARVSLAQLGMPDVYLVVRFRVREP